MDAVKAGASGHPACSQSNDRQRVALFVRKLASQSVSMPWRRLSLAAG